MPWCDECAKFWNPSSMGRDGTCPTCGRSLDRPHVGLAPHPGDEADAPEVASAAEEEPVGEVDDGERLRAPWHFKVLILALVIYLGWRLVQLIQWLV